MLKQFIQQAKVIVFDMDGTLYEGTGHFRLLAENIKHHLPEDQQQAYMSCYESFKQGNSPLKIGTVYDAEYDVIFEWDPFAERLSKARNWDNEPVSVQDVPDRLGVKDFDFQRWVPIGDGWWPPHVIGRHFGLTNEHTETAYHQTKEQMAEKQDYLTPTPGLKTFLESISPSKKLVLMTNSEKNDVQRILSQLGIDHLFKDRITSAYKPVKTRDHLERIIDTYQVNPEEVLSVGDNFMNEIAPALQLGVKAIWITQSNQVPVKDERYINVPTLENIHVIMG